MTERDGAVDDYEAAIEKLREAARTPPLPSWFRIALGAVFVALVLVSVIGVLLSVAVNRLTASDERDRQLQECVDAFAQVIGTAAQETRSAAAEMNAGVARGLLAFLPEELLPPGHQPVFEASELLAAIDNAETAADADHAAVQARDDWYVAGRPLPCPMDTPSLED